MRLYNYMKCYANLTRAELTKLNNENRILVNGIKIPLPDEVKDGDVVTLDGKEILAKEFVYYMYYKPRGILSTVSNRKDSFIHYLDLDFKPGHAGRLDKESEGLLILSNDGKFLNEITAPESHYEKEYVVAVKNPITDAFMESIQKSYLMDNRITKPIKATKIDEYRVSMILSEGLYHQIRRIVKESQNYVMELKRIRIGEYLLSDMKPGELRQFNRKK